MSYGTIVKKVARALERPECCTKKPAEAGQFHQIVLLLLGRGSGFIAPGALLSLLLLVLLLSSLALFFRRCGFVVGGFLFPGVLH